MSNDLIEVRNLIYVIRGKRVMLDSDLASLYEVETFNLNKAVKRNIERFPSDFMFQLSHEELNLIFQNGIPSSHGGRRYLPYVFTEQGIAMLSSVLRSKKAIEINIHIMRTFVELRQLAIEHKDLSMRLSDVEKFLMNYAKENNAEIDKINQAIDLLMDRTKPTQIGFEINTKNNICP